MKKAIKLTLMLALVAGTTSVFAQKFGRINTQQLVQAMPETTQMQTDLQKLSEELRGQLEAVNVEFTNKMQEFEKALPTMSESAAQMKQKELNDLRTHFTELQEFAQNELQRKQQEMAQPIWEKMEAAVAKVSKEGGYLIVFDEASGAMTYFDPQALTDLMAAVKTELGIK